MALAGQAVAMQMRPSLRCGVSGTSPFNHNESRNKLHSSVTLFAGPGTVPDCTWARQEAVRNLDKALRFGDVLYSPWSTYTPFQKLSPFPPHQDLHQPQEADGIDLFSSTEQPQLALARPTHNSTTPPPSSKKDYPPTPQGERHQFQPQHPSTHVSTPPVYSPGTTEND